MAGKLLGSIFPTVPTYFCRAARFGTVRPRRQQYSLFDLSPTRYEAFLCPTISRFLLAIWLAAGCSRSSAATGYATPHHAGHYPQTRKYTGYSSGKIH
jgi:hypothetical protein